MLDKTIDYILYIICDNRSFSRYGFKNHEKMIDRILRNYGSNYWDTTYSTIGIKEINPENSLKTKPCLGIRFSCSPIIREEICFCLANKIQKLYPEETFTFLTLNYN